MMPPPEVPHPDRLQPRGETLPGRATLAPPRPRLVEDPYGLSILCCLAGVALAWSYPLWEAAWHTVCPLRALTGIPCPTCYGTRAILALLSGDFSAALRLNPLVSAAGIAVVGWMPFAAGAVAGLWPRPHLTATATVRLARLGVALATANWAFVIIAHH